MLSDCSHRRRGVGLLSRSAGGLSGLPGTGSTGQASGEGRSPSIPVQELGTETIKLLIEVSTLSKRSSQTPEFEELHYYQKATEAAEKS